jgi:hypothetical protein
MAVPSAMRAAAGKRCPGTAPPGLRRLLALTLATCAAMLIGGSTPDGAARGLASHHPLRPSAGTTARAGTSVVCVLAPGATKLPPNAVRGLAHHLRQYPAPSLATAAQRRAARDLLATIRAAASRWQDPRQAARAGFDTREAKRRAGDTTVHYLHAEHRRFSHDGRYLDPQRPESLIYANAPGRPLQLVGVMFSMPRGLHGPTPGGAIARWHSHLVCVAGDKRGLKPSPNGSCPRGSKRRQGSEMMHVWLTRDLRSAYAIHAPEPELCVAGLLSPARCLHTRGGQGM